MFRNRGEIPNLDLGNSKENKEYSAPHYRNYWNGKFIIVKYDKTFVIIQMLTVLIFCLIIASTYLFIYNPKFEDPIYNSKKILLNLELGTIAVSSISIGLITFFTKSSKENLAQRLGNTTILIAIALILLIGIKINYDKNYTKEYFENYYENTYSNVNKELDPLDAKISIGITGIKMSTAKEYYIDTAISSYMRFSIKSTIYLVIIIAIEIINIYLINRINTLEEKRKKLAKDDAIFQDE